MRTRILPHCLAIILVLPPVAASAFVFADYYPLPMGQTWVYVNEDQPADTFANTVSEPHEVDGQPAVKFGEESGLQFACWNDGAAVTWYHGWVDGGFMELDPDVTLGTIADGETFTWNCAGCSAVLVRDWDALDPVDRQVYGIDPGYDHLLVLAAYDADQPPNAHNAIIEANLPGGASPPMGAVTDLEWYQVGVGLTVYREVDASTGDLGAKYVLDQVLPIRAVSWSEVKASFRDP